MLKRRGNESGGASFALQGGPYAILYACGKNKLAESVGNNEGERGTVPFVDSACAPSVGNPRDSSLLL